MKDTKTKIKRCGVFYVKTIFPYGNKLEWLNYLQIDSSIPKNLYLEIDKMVDYFNKKYESDIKFPINKGMTMGCICSVEILDELTSEFYDSYNHIFSTVGVIEPYIRLVFGTLLFEEENITDIHKVGTQGSRFNYKQMTKIGKLLDGSKKGYFKLED